MKQRRIVVTGYGIATTKGIGVREFEENFDDKSDDYQGQEISQVACELFSSNTCRRMDDFTRYGVVAAKEAIDNSGLELQKTDTSRAGIIFSTIWGPIVTTYNYFYQVLKDGPNKASPFLFPYTVTNAVVGAIARLLSIAGVNTMLVGCSSINYAIDLLESRKADVILAGCSDDLSILEEKLGLQLDSQALRVDGSVVIVLEGLEHAEKRGASILAEIIDYRSRFIAEDSNFISAMIKNMNSIQSEHELLINDIVGMVLPVQQDSVTEEVLKSFPNVDIDYKYGCINTYALQPGLQLIEGINQLKQATDKKHKFVAVNSLLNHTNLDTIFITEYLHE